MDSALIRKSVLSHKTQRWAISLLICIASIVPVCAQPIRINFQPPGEVPEGYLPDHGEVFGDRGNGFIYGWDTEKASDMYNRHSSSYSDLRYDTLLRFPKENEATWEITLENGVYDVFLVSGDPCSTNQSSHFEVEGNQIDSRFSPYSHEEHALTTIVSDERLTLKSRDPDPYKPDSYKPYSISLLEIRPSVGPRQVFPSDTSDGIPQNALLHWSRDPFYEKYNVYFGETFNDVNEGTVPIALGLDVNSFNPGFLEWGKTYYWRVDGVCSADNEGVVQGKVSNFQVESFENSDKVRMPDPASGSTDISPDTVAAWRAGRDAGMHVVYMDTDVNEVLSGTAASLTSDVNSIDLTPFNLLLGETYYWRVDEMDHFNATVDVGPVWSFSTSEFLVVDDFEYYTNWYPDEVFRTWIDGYGYSMPYIWPYYTGNGTGAALGHDIWKTSSEHFAGSVMETSIVHSGRQSVPFYHTSSRDGQITYSQADLTFDRRQDWRAHGMQTLVLYFFGNPRMTDRRLCAKINETKVIYPDDEDLQEPAWHQWAIDLASLNEDLQFVRSLHIGIEGPGTEEFIHPIYIDDIRLYRDPPEPIVACDPGAEAVVALYSLENDTNDTSGHGRHGVAVGNPTYQTGLEGTGLAFDGTGDQYVDLGTFDPSNDTGQLSVAMWLKRTGRVDVYQGLMGKRDIFSDQDMMWQIELNQNSGAIAFTRHGGEFVSSLALLRPDEWTHVTVTYDGEMASLFVNGQLTSNGPFALGPDTEATLVLGACGANGENPFHGVIDEVAIYNRALSLGEVRFLAGDR